MIRSRLKVINVHIFINDEFYLFTDVLIVRKHFMWKRKTLFHNFYRLIIINSFPKDVDQTSGSLS